MEKHIKNIDFSTSILLKEQVSYLKGQVVSKTLAQNNAVSLTLFAFDQGEEISSHESTGDAMVTLLDGTCIVTIDGNKHPLKVGETIVMPSKLPHSVYASEQFKMLLTVIFPIK